MSQDESMKIRASAEGVELEVTGEGSKRLTSSFVDALSPFTEFLGTLGDEVRRFRVHRELVAQRTLEQAKRIRDERAIEAKPVSPKLLAPWLEGASLEDDGEENISDLWATLLAECPSDFSAEYAIIIEVLRKIGRKEALALEEFLPHHNRSGMFEFPGEHDGVYEEYINFHIEKIKAYFEKDSDDPDEYALAIFSQFNSQRTSAYGIPARACSILASSGPGEKGIKSLVNSEFAQKHGDALKVLEHVGLVSLRQVFFQDEDSGIGGYVVIFELTSLGKKMLRILYPVHLNTKTVSVDSEGNEIVEERKLRL